MRERGIVGGKRLGYVRLERTVGLLPAGKNVLNRLEVAPRRDGNVKTLRRRDQRLNLLRRAELVPLLRLG